MQGLIVSLRFAVSASSARRGSPDPAVTGTEGLPWRKMWRQNGRPAVSLGAGGRETRAQRPWVRGPETRAQRPRTARSRKTLSLPRFWQRTHNKTPQILYGEAVEQHSLGSRSAPQVASQSDQQTLKGVLQPRHCCTLSGCVRLFKTATLRCAARRWATLFNRFAVSHNRLSRWATIVPNSIARCAGGGEGTFESAARLTDR